jgi:hypothetical protein
MPKPRQQLMLLLLLFGQLLPKERRAPESDFLI